MDKIIINGINLYGYHGVFAEEKKLGQNFIIDIEVYSDLKIASETDDLNFSVNYAEIYENVKEVFESKKFNLIESLAENITIKILNNDLIKKVNVQVKKPSAPINGIFNYVAVDITREK